jgi:hypothetical protein
VLRFYYPPTIMTGFDPALSGPKTGLNKNFVLVWKVSRFLTPKGTTMATELPFRFFDCDNHYYEALDAFTR